MVGYFALNEKSRTTDFACQTVALSKSRRCVGAIQPERAGLRIGASGRLVFGAPESRAPALVHRAQPSKGRMLIAPSRRLSAREEAAGWGYGGVRHRSGLKSLAQAVAVLRNATWRFTDGR